MIAGIHTGSRGSGSWGRIRNNTDYDWEFHISGWQRQGRRFCRWLFASRARCPRHDHLRAGAWEPLLLLPRAWWRAM